MIPITQSFLPPPEEYYHYLERVWETGRLTTNGPLARELTQKLEKVLEVPHLLFVSNGTVALEIAIEALGLSGEIITTPFTYVATAGSIAWRGCTPVFADIHPETLTLDPEKAEAVITKRTSAILATHVYGHPCDTQALEALAARHGLKVIYDGAHAFGVRYRGQSIYNYGDLSTVSFHATKLFHTVEGGGVIAQEGDLLKKLIFAHNQGHLGNDQGFNGLGTNGKNSEFHAAMGLCNLNYLSSIMAKRKTVTEHYDSLLEKAASIRKPSVLPETEINYAYYPLIFDSEERLLKVVSALNQSQIFPRRYFHPSLSRVDFAPPCHTPIADDIATRALCLPLSTYLEPAQIELITSLMLKHL